ncbi:hypothetical protein MMC07_003385 [Pseudocyphellaria aurata]|nr:hypothetical protein [Pseudocyphellaria aurata]
MAFVKEDMAKMREQMAFQQQLNVGQSLGSPPVVESDPMRSLLQLIRNGLAAPPLTLPPRAQPGGYAPVVHDADAVLLSLPGLLARQHRELMGALKALTEAVERGGHRTNIGHVSTQSFGQSSWW